MNQTMDYQTKPYYSNSFNNIEICFSQIDNLCIQQDSSLKNGNFTSKLIIYDIKNSLKNKA
jgi:hypothetical protein